MTKKEIDRFAKEQGYAGGCVYLREWNGYSIYEPLFDDSGEPCVIGPPLVVMVSGETIRMSTEEEAFQTLEEDIL